MSDTDEGSEMGEQRGMQRESRLMWMFGPEVAARPWSEIAGFFRWIVGSGGEWARPMRVLVEQIGACPYADRLFAIRAAVRHDLLEQAILPGPGAGRGAAPRADERVDSPGAGNPRRLIIRGVFLRARAGGG